MSNSNVTSGTPSPQQHDAKRAPGAPQQHENDRKDAGAKEGKPHEGSKPQQK